MWIAAYGPAPQPSGFGEARPIEPAVVSGLATLAVVLARLARAIQKKQRVMHHFARTRPEFHGFHPLVFGQLQRNGEVAIDIRTGRRELESLRHGEHHVRLTQLPSLGEL